jgi:hypothetical protein
MKTVVLALFALTVIGSTAAWADADDTKWVAQCVKDNGDAKVAVEIITKYCTCMNGKMSSNETQSITQWEKAHVAEREACDKESGWK